MPALRGGFLAGFAVGIWAAGALWLGASALRSARAPEPAAPYAPSAPTPGRAEEAATAAGAQAAPAAEPLLPAKPGPPVFAKLVARPLSREPHQVLAAWDEDAEAPSPGERRAFVLAVSPLQSDESLAALARDVRAENRDARLLEVRIYDDAAAAVAPRFADGGRSTRAHLVAEVQRNEAAGLDLIRVRGRSVPP